MARSSVKLAISAALVLAGARVICAQAPAPTKPATINVQAAILSTKEGQQSTQDLSARVSARKQALEQRQSNLAQLQSRMRVGSATMSQAARDKLIADIDAQTKAWNRDSADFNTEVQAEEGKIMNDVGQKMLPLIEKYALLHGILLVADVSNPQSPVVWADPSLDITNEIIKMYDQTYPPAPATPPATPPTKKQ
ncbi:Outer membrane chaperone Skp (OmpH) [Candidatus Sulfopaludibacter sp. SbA4]|nr:Outer membrane chaperone Skp (OmpH) [Candidatus Sulfopaludibacter sp. SbA4]